MRPMMRTVVVSSFVAALTVVGLFACPSLAQDVGGLWYAMDDSARIRAAEESNARLDRETELALWRITLRQEVVRDVADGRLGPDEAADRFAELNRMHASTLAYVRKRFPGRSDAESAAWQLAHYLRVTGEPAAVAAAERLERRLRGSLDVTARSGASG